MNTIRIQVNPGREKWFAGLWQSWTSIIQTCTNYWVSAPAPKWYGYHADALKKRKQKKVRPTVAEWEMITAHAFIIILNLKRVLFQKPGMVQWEPSQLHVKKNPKQNTNKRYIRSPMLRNIINLWLLLKIVLRVFDQWMLKYSSKCETTQTTRICCKELAVALRWTLWF